MLRVMDILKQVRAFQRLVNVRLWPEKERNAQEINILI